jgi:hypothetical protein
VSALLGYKADVGRIKGGTKQQQEVSTGDVEQTVSSDNCLWIHCNLCNFPMASDSINSVAGIKPKAWHVGPDIVLPITQLAKYQY